MKFSTESCANSALCQRAFFRVLLATLVGAGLLAADFGTLHPIARATADGVRASSPVTTADEAAAAAAPADASAEAPVGTPQLVSRIRLAHDVTLAALSNGLTIIVQENHVAPVATVRCVVRNTGSAFEEKYLGAGLSHVLEHVVAGGTTAKRSEKEVERIIDGFGGATNAFTTTDMTSFFIDCPAKNVMTAIELLADSMQHIKFEPTEFARELRVVRRELADGEVDRDRVLWKMLGQTIYLENPARHPVIGYLEVLNQTTNETIIDFYHCRYVPNNQVFVVVGDVDTDAVLEAVAKQWTGTPRGFETFVPLPDEPLQVSPREAIREMDGQNYDMTFAWPTVKLSDPDMYALDVAAYILTKGDSSRLVRRLKYDEGLVLSVDSASYTPFFVRGFFAIMATSPPQTWQKAGDAILAEVTRLQDELVTPAELEKAKKQKAAELVFQRQTVQSEADSLGQSYVSSGDPLFDEQYVQNIERVTAEQVREAARKYLIPMRLNRIMIAPPGGAPQAAGKTVAAGESPIRMATLPNGVRVLVKRLSHLPLVNIQAYTLGSTLVDTPENAGRAALVAQMLDQGAGPLSAEEIADYFDSVGGQISFSAGRFTVLGSATTLTGDFPRAAEIFADCLLRPQFPEAKFNKMKRLALLSIASRKDDPQGEVSELFYDSLPATSPFHVNPGGTLESVERLTLADLRAYHAQYIVPQNLLVTVFGDIEPEAALALARKHFGGLQPAADFQRPNFDRSNAITENVARHKQTGKETGMVLLAYEAPSILQQEDFAAITLLDAVMSGYSYPGGWLHTELRGAGLVYGVHAYTMAGPAPGFFVAMAQTRPDAVAEVVRRIQVNVEKARRGEITDDEFETAVKMVIALHAQENTTIASQAQEAALDELYGLGYGYSKGFDDRIRAVRRDDLTRVANKYLRDHVLVTASPDKGEE